jgi:hypothetical protein
VSRSAAFFASLLVVLGRPGWWLLALAGFLVRGGIVLAVLPIVSLPSPLVISNLVAPLIVPLALGHVDGGAIAAIAAIVAGLVGWLIVGGFVGAATDLALIREGLAAATDEGVTGRQVGDLQLEMARRRGGTGVVARILAVRLLAHVPLAAALAIGSIGIANVTYLELTRPADVASPLVLRIAAAAARPLAAIVVAWFLGELVGGTAARRIVIEGDGVRAALGGAIVALVRRPRSTVVPALVTTIPLLAILGGTLGGARIAWLRADAALIDPTIDGATLVLTLLIFVAIWLAALTLIGVMAAARSAALTFEVARVGAARYRSAALLGNSGDAVDGTFGASAHHRPGDWPVGDDGGSL